MYIDILFSRWNKLPIVIEGRLGYVKETVKVAGGIRTYHWIKVGPVGIEVTASRRALTG